MAAPPATPALLLVDPFSTGDTLARHILSRGVPLIIVLSSMRDTAMAWREDEKCALAADGGLQQGCVATLQHGGEGGEGGESIACTVAALAALPFTVADVLVGAESGVVLADALATALGLRGNGAQTTRVRTSKYEQHEALRRAGLAACAQGLVASEAELDALLSSSLLPPPTVAAPLVVKSVDGSGQQGVHKCCSATEVREAFRAVHGATNMLGRRCDAVMVQECLPGAEFTVDTVSSEGAHKCVALWRQERRATSPASPFTYIGQSLLSIDSAADGAAGGEQEAPGLQLSALVEYVFAALDAIGVRFGACCAEVKYGGPAAAQRGPVLVEVNCRLDGGGGAWVPLVEATGLGYTQVSALTDSYLDAGAYAAIPTVPTLPGGMRGHTLTIRSPVGGVVKRVRDEVFERIRALPSFLSMNLVGFPAAGETILETVDMMTYYGCIDLVHADAGVLQRDCDVLRAIMNTAEEALVEVE